MSTLNVGTVTTTGKVISQLTTAETYPLMSKFTRIQ